MCKSKRIPLLYNLNISAVYCFITYKYNHKEQWHQFD